MASSSPKVRPSPAPNVWRIGKLTIAGAVMGGFLLLFCTAMLAAGKFRVGFGIDALRTLTMSALVFGGEATLYSIRERRRVWSSRPSLWVVLPIFVVGGTLAAAAVLAFIVDFAKVPVFNRLGIG